MPEYQIIDVDTHITEVPEVWSDRLPQRMRDQAPRIITDDRGRDWWLIGGKKSAVSGGVEAQTIIGDDVDGYGANANLRVNF